MKLEFSKMKKERMDNFKGGNLYIMANIYFDGVNKVLVADLPPKASIGEHKHEVDSELIFIERGTPLAICDGKEERLKAGDVHYCKKGSTHTLINDTDKLVKIKAIIAIQ